MADPEAVVSPGGVGFDINCGVRLLRTNLHERDVEPVKELLCQTLFNHIPVGVGSQGIIPTTPEALEAALEMGMDWRGRFGGGLRWGRGEREPEPERRLLRLHTHTHTHTADVRTPRPP